MSGLVLLISLFAAPRAFANAFQLPDQDAAATGRAGAVLADPTNPSAIAYNPAGIAALEGFQANVGFNLILPRADYKDGAGALTKAAALNFFIPDLYLTYRLSKIVSVGIGEGTNYGLTIQWPGGSPGRSVVLEQALQTFDISAVVGFELSAWVRGLRLAGGIDVVPASVYLTKDILFGGELGSVALAGNALGVGGRAGAQWQPQWVRGLSLGVVYRSPVALGFSGNANFQAPIAYRAELPPDGTGRTQLTLPQTFGAGVAYRVCDPLEFEFDFGWTNWASFSQLILTLPGGTTSVSPKLWNDTVTLRIGAEYTLFSSLAIRAGFVYDQSPVPATTLDFTLPDADRKIVAVGLGYQFIKAVRADVGALFILPASRATSPATYQPPIKGTFDISAVTVGLNLVVKLDAPRGDRVAQQPTPAPETMVQPESAPASQP